MINVKEEVVTLSIYTTSDGAKFRDKEEAFDHEEIVNKANILCDTNRVRFMMITLTLCQCLILD